MLSSRTGLRILAALTQFAPEGARLRELARAIRARDSSAQRALASLARSGIVEAVGPRRRTFYQLNEGHPAARASVELALNQSPREEVLGVLARSNRGVEFASLRTQGSTVSLLVVYANASTSAERLRFQRALQRFRGAPRVDLAEREHEDLVERLIEGPEIRDRAERDAVLKGTIARSFPDRRRHGSFTRARPLGALHPTLHRPSRRALQRLADRYGLRRIALFGSAVRSDFRPDSDVDVLVSYDPARQRTFAEILGLERDLEALFDRDINIVDEQRLPEEFKPAVERHEVRLLG